MGPRRILSIAVVLATGIGTGLTTVGAQAGAARGSYHQTNLVSDLPGAKFTDPHLKNPWGLSSSPSSPIWVSDNNAGVTTLYLGDGTAVADELENLRGDERHRFGMVQAHAAGEPLLCEYAGLMKRKFIELLRREMHTSTGNSLIHQLSIASS